MIIMAGESGEGRNMLWQKPISMSRPFTQSSTCCFYIDM